MRDLLNIIDGTILTEGVGLSNRKPGEQFKNSVDDVITFQGLTFYPESGTFPEDQLSQAIDAAAAENQTTSDRIHWTNVAPRGAAGFGIAKFTGEDGSPYFLGRWFRTVSPNRVQNSFPHDAIPGGFRFQSRAGQKESSGLKPSDWLTQFRDNTPDTILKQCRDHFGADSDEARALEAFIQGDVPLRIARGNLNAEGFRDYFAEVLQPIALVMGKNVGGNAAEAAEIFFGESGFENCTISFNNNTIGGLYDSLLINPDGRQIKLSSKGKDGASASVTNLQKSVAELASVPAGDRLMKKYQEEIEILDIIEKNGHFGAPLKLAVKYDQLTPEEATQVLSLKNLGPNDDIIGSGLLSSRLEKMYQSRKAKDPSRIIPIEHMISAVAYMMADYVNKNTNFGQAAADILNNAALVQMYTDTSVSGDNITISRLTAVYPSKTVTGVMLDASKVYFSTGGKGNYTFTILKNGAKPTDVNPMDSVEADPAAAAPARLDTDSLNQVGQQSRLIGPGARAARAAAEPQDTEQVLGRRRR